MLHSHGSVSGSVAAMLPALTLSMITSHLSPKTCSQLGYFSASHARSSLLTAAIGRHHSVGRQYHRPMCSAWCQVSRPRMNSSQYHGFFRPYPSMVWTNWSMIHSSMNSR